MSFLNIFFCQISELAELQEVLGVHEVRDEKEKELEAFIFGCDANNLEKEFLKSDSEEVLYI